MLGHISLIYRHSSITNNKSIFSKLYNRYLLVVVVYAVSSTLKNRSWVRFFCPVLLKVDSILSQHMAQEKHHIITYASVSGWVLCKAVIKTTSELMNTRFRIINVVRRNKIQAVLFELIKGEGAMA